MASILRQLRRLSCSSPPTESSDEDVDEKRDYTRVVEIFEKREIRIVNNPPTPRTTYRLPPPPPPPPSETPAATKKTGRAPDLFQGWLDPESPIQDDEKPEDLESGCCRCRARRIRCSGLSGEETACQNCINAGSTLCVFMKVHHDAAPENPFKDPKSSRPSIESELVNVPIRRQTTLKPSNELPYEAIEKPSTLDPHVENKIVVSDQPIKPSPPSDLDLPAVHERLHLYRRSVRREDEQVIMGDEWRSVKASLNPKPDVVRPTTTTTTTTPNPPARPHLYRRGVVREEEQLVMGDQWRSVKASLNPKPDIVRPPGATAPRR